MNMSVPIEISHQANGVENGSSPNALLTADEVAALLRVTTGWVYAQTRANRIPHVRLGRYVRFRAHAIQAWLGTLERARSQAAGRMAGRGRDGDRG